MRGFFRKLTWFARRGHGVRSRRLALAALLSAAPLVLSGVFSVYWVWSAQA
jgi:hypothetical protein